MSKVICKRATYKRELLRSTFFEVMDFLGGSAIKENAKVLIKPNLLAPAKPDSAMLTHPQMVQAAVEYVLEKGGKPQVSDSPAMGTFEKVLRESGIRDALKGLPVECKEFKRSVSVDVGEPFKRIEIAEDVLESDFVINLPKLKTHAQMLLTLAVKNLFGCVVGLRKPEWHMRAGVNREMFAMLLVRICQKISPSFNVLDGILAMEGQGPGRAGSPREVGVMIGSNNPFELDAAVCRMLGLPPESLLTSVMGENAGIVSRDLQIIGDFPEVKGFILPEIGDLVFGPAKLQKFMRGHLTQRPVLNKSLCKTCGDCLRYCPAQAICLSSKKIGFDYEKCIRCYCCIEVCPHGALKSEEPFLGKLFRMLVRSRSS